jgi:hypothetical protein
MVALSRLDPNTSRDNDSVGVKRFLRNSFVQIGLCLYEAHKWIYGTEAFGLRLAAWVARKAPDARSRSIDPARPRNVWENRRVSNFRFGMAETGSVFYGDRVLIGLMRMKMRD